MADIAAADLTYSIVHRDQAGNRKQVIVDVTMGDGTDTYPSGGIPLTKAKMGLPNSLEGVNVMEEQAGDGFIYKYDASAEKIRMYQGDYSTSTDGELVELGSVAVTTATLRLQAWGY